VWVDGCEGGWVGVRLGGGVGGRECGWQGVGRGLVWKGLMLLPAAPARASKGREVALSLCRFINRHTLKIASRTLSDVINRERLCGTNAFYLVTQERKERKTEKLKKIPRGTRASPGRIQYFLCHWDPKIQKNHPWGPGVSRGEYRIPRVHGIPT